MSLSISSGGVMKREEKKLFGLTRKWLALTLLGETKFIKIDWSAGIYFFKNRMEPKVFEYKFTCYPKSQRKEYSTYVCSRQFGFQLSKLICLFFPAWAFPCEKQLTFFVLKSWTKKIKSGASLNKFCAVSQLFCPLFVNEFFYSSSCPLQCSGGRRSFCTLLKCSFLSVLISEGGSLAAKCNLHHKSMEWDWALAAAAAATRSLCLQFLCKYNLNSSSSKLALVFTLYFHGDGGVSWE